MNMESDERIEVYGISFFSKTCYIKDFITFVMKSLIN